MQPVQATIAAERPASVQRPDKNGRFGKFGGKYVPETLIPALLELEQEYERAKSDPAFQVPQTSVCLHSSHCYHRRRSWTISSSTMLAVRLHCTMQSAFPTTFASALLLLCWWCLLKGSSTNLCVCQTQAGWSPAQDLPQA